MCDFFKQNFYVREIFELIIECNETGNYEILKEIEFDVPDYFNWSEEIFEGIRLRNFPDKKALIWKSDILKKSIPLKK
jgi:hypothetical protein